MNYSDNLILDSGDMNHSADDAFFIFKRKMLKFALKNDLCLYSSSCSVSTTSDTHEEIGKFFNSKKLKKVYGSVNHLQGLYVDSDVEHMNVCSVHYFPDSLSVEILSFNSEFVNSIYKKIYSYHKPAPPGGKVYSILKDPDGGYYLSSIGIGGIPLVRENYIDSVLEKYDYCLNDLKSKDPSGRLVLLDGAPGSGKTYIVRSFMNDIQTSKFVLIPPGMLEGLTGPDLIKVLIENHSDSEPIILIIEDADHCLVSRDSERGKDNVSAISALLNIGDGIMGSVLDVRIIATTNVSIDQIDSAIKRDGRLVDSISVNYLPLDFAKNRFYQLLGNKKSAFNLNTDITIANVYKLARKAGWKNTANKV